MFAFYLYRYIYIFFFNTDVLKRVFPLEQKLPYMTFSEDRFFLILHIEMKKVLQFLASVRIHIPYIYHVHIKTRITYHALLK